MVQAPNPDYSSLRFERSHPRLCSYILLTILEVIQRSAEFLEKKGVDSPRLQTELLLAHILKLPRRQLYLNFERSLSEAELDSFRELIKRRGQREPLQHIVGSVSFCGLEIGVNPRVLIPRSETELLAEHGWQFLNQLSSPNPQLLTALDWGTGSGCLAIAFAVKCPRVEVYASDISPEALDLARQNAARHGVVERIHFLQGDGFTAIPAGTQFDLLISNPPYIPSAEIETLQPEVRDYDPRQALDGGPDGLDCILRLALEAAHFLKPHAKMMLEFGDGQAEGVRQIFTAQKWIVESIVEDYTRRARIAITRKANETNDK